jgi:thioredoxin-related protein
MFYKTLHLILNRKKYPLKMVIRIKLIFLMTFAFASTLVEAQERLLVFYDTECPICQKSSKRLQEMYEKYGQNVAFKAVFSTKSLKKSDVKQFHKEYSFTIPYVIDRKHRLVERYDAKTTPEVVLLNKKGEKYIVERLIISFLDWENTVLKLPSFISKMRWKLYKTASLSLLVLQKQ